MKSLVRAVVKSFASRASYGLLAAAALLAVTAGRSEALELVPGGYGAPAVEPESALPAESPGIGRGSEGVGLSLDFTPRYAAGSAWGGAAAEAAGPRFDLTIAADPGDRFEQLGLASGSSALYPRNRRTGQASLTVGGAMRWSGWSLGGGFGRSQILGTDVDLFSASIGYGRLSAELAYGQPVIDSQTAPRDVLMLNTDLAAWSWLTLESGIAVGTVPSAEREGQSVAVGRLGLRLNF